MEEEDYVLPAGTKLNQIIWWKVYDMKQTPPNNNMLLLPNYSGDIAEAWKIVEMYKEDLQEINYSNREWYVCFVGGSAYAETAPLAICRAIIHMFS